MLQINPKHCEFHDHSNMVRNIYNLDGTGSPDFERMERKLNKKKKKYYQGSVEYDTIDKLQKDVEKKNLEGMKSTAKQFVLQFGSSTLANLVGKYITGLLGF